MSETTEIIDLVFKGIGLCGSALVAGLAIRTYLRNDEWKRAEFLAGKMKEFMDSTQVRNALVMIDWSARKIPLFGQSPDEHVLVTRGMSTKALHPHTIDGENAKVEGTFIDGAFVRSYTPEEAAIRDCFDAFLDGLERINAYREAQLVTVEQLKPHLEYWIRDIAAPAQSPAEAAWSATLLTYIKFYGFVGVMALFKEFGYPIETTSDIFKGFLEKMDDKDLASKLKAQAMSVRPQFDSLDPSRA